METARFVLILSVAVVDHLLHEIVLSFNTTWDFVRYRLRWIVKDKLVATMRRRR